MSIENTKKKKIQLKYKRIMQQREDEKNYSKDIFIIAIILLLIIILFTFFDYNPLQNDIIRIEKVR